MKLDDAYNAWGGQSENRELAQKTKKIFHNIWWLIPTNQPCNYYTLEVLGRALVQTNGAQSDKVKAASVMCHVLNYAHNIDPEGNNKPDFIFSDILNYTGEKDDRGQVPGSQQTSEDAPARDLSPVIPSQPLVKVKPAAKAKRMAELAKRDGGEAATKAAIKREKNDAGIGSSEREQARRDNGKAAKAVVQLDAETLKPVKVWPSCFAAQKELGIKNVQRAIVRHGISGGFYWCRPGDEEGFKPIVKRGRKNGKNNTKTEKTEKPKYESILAKDKRELMRRVFDGPERQPTDEQGDARGQSPDREPVKVQSPGIERPQPETLQEAHENFQQAINEHVDSILRSCTDDELIAELRRREWHGTLRITRTIEL